jgi:hypothetical protein
MRFCREIVKESLKINLRLRSLADPVRKAREADVNRWFQGGSCLYVAPGEGGIHSPYISSPAALGCLAGMSEDLPHPASTANSGDRERSIRNAQATLMPDPVHNARVRLAASALSNIAVAVTVAGIAFLVISEYPLLWRGLAALAATGIGGLLHWAARRHLGRLKP